MKNFILMILVVGLTGCAVRQKDLDAWVGMPVEALETHSFFITVPVFKTKTASGIEIWNYANGADVARCFGNASLQGGNRYYNSSSFATCTSNRVVCNNIFYIRDGIVLEYKPTGSCYTDESVQPEPRYRKLIGR